MNTKSFKSYEETEESIDLSKPTEEEYVEGKRQLEFFASCIHCSRKRQNELLDELCEERASEKLYKDNYDRVKDVVRRYEIYKELENNG